MKKVLCVFLAFMMLCTSFAGVEIVYAADNTSASSSAENAIELPCDSKWKSCSGSSSTVYYKITVADTGKLKLKIKTSSEIESQAYQPNRLNNLLHRLFSRFRFRKENG
ncbi:MAG: hypothetical protein LUG95_07790 [Clostridiales bacterium]|nr:hypothetical protein [Clostridiales bacterium]